jgi:hypothetical protein
MKLFLQEVIEGILTAMKGPVEEGRILAPLLRWLKVDVLPEVLLLFISAIVLAALLIGAVFAVHWLISLVRKRRTRVFISFHHEREPIADALADEMTKCGIRAEKLPFVESPDSDTLLDQVNQGIRDCDIFVCVPGKFPSFVDGEVSKAHGLLKPMLFVFVEADAPPRLSNYAKKGYPVFALEGLQREGFRTLVNFCSYLAADWRSTARLYAAVFRHLKACAELIVAVFIVSIVILTNVANPQIAEETKKLIDQGHTIDERLGSLRTVVSNPEILWFLGPPLILFLVPYGLFFISRWANRANVRRVISGKKFRDTFIPETLAYSLTRADLLKILYQGDIVKHHESGRPDAKSA